MVDLRKRKKEKEGGGKKKDPNKPTAFRHLQYNELEVSFLFSLVVSLSPFFSRK